MFVFVVVVVVVVVVVCLLKKKGLIITLKFDNRHTAPYEVYLFRKVHLNVAALLQMNKHIPFHPVVR